MENIRVLEGYSEKRCLCLMKWPSEMVQNLPYFIYIRKTKVAFSVFHFVLHYFCSLNECPDQCQHKPGHLLGEKNKVAWNEKWKKQLGFFIYIKYGKFWSILQGHFIKHKPLISEEWYIVMYLIQNIKISQRQRIGRNNCIF